MLYNHKAKSGALYHKIKNAKAKKGVPHAEMTEDDLKKFLKYCCVTKDKPKLKEKLLETISLRRKLFKENSGEFSDFFNFYMVDITMVCTVDRVNNI